MCFEQVIRIMSALLTPVIAIVATYIAWQQWKTNRQKLAMDLYDRRLRIYQEVRKILSSVFRDANISMQALLEFYSSVSEVHFLFGPEISEYIDEIYKHGTNLGRYKDEYRDHTQPSSEGYDHKKVVEEMNKELQWLVYQFEPAKELFRKYLRLEN